MATPAWYWNRLTRMSLREVMSRAVAVADKRIWRWTAAGSQVPEPAAPHGPQAQALSVSGKHSGKTAIVAAADAIVARQFAVLGETVPHADDCPQWNCDPRTGRQASMAFGPTLDYRNERLVGDIKFLWELNRHLHLPTLAQAYQLTASATYRTTLQRHLLSWLEQCPYPQGANWSSSLELAIRLINWSLAWRICDGDIFDDDGQRDRFLRSVYQHCYFIQRHYSGHSSANNHLIGEAVGVFVAAIVWPHWAEMQQWGEDALHILSREIPRQTTAEGFNVELSTGYQEFVMEFAAIALATAQSAGVDVDEAYRDAIVAMAECIDYFADVAGNVPLFADADNGHVYRLAHGDDYRSLASLKVVCSALSALPNASERTDVQANWLLGTTLQDVPNKVAVDTNRAEDRAFTGAGYYLLGKDLGSDNEIRAWVDAGPLGYLSIAAHGHADALSLYLSAYGEELLIDPGTYAYHAEKRWRDYFRGTAAHNTARIDGVDQSVSGGNFMWLRHAQTTVLAWEPGSRTARLEAHHDGYRRLDDPLDHTRSVTLDKERAEIVVDDRLDCRGYHDIELFWHLAEHVQVTDLAPAGWTLVGNAVSADITMDATGVQLQTARFTGDEQRPAGWISRQFGEKTPTSTLCARFSVTGSQKIRTKIALRKH